MKMCFTILLITIGLTSHSQDYSKNKIPCEKVVYPIHYYHVKAPYFLLDQYKDSGYLNILGLVADLNIMLAKTCIEFKVCKIDTIFDYNYNLQEDDLTNEDANFISMNYDPHAINIYRVLDTNKVSYFGVCWQKKALPAILVDYGDRDIISSSTLNTFTSQICRYFGLKHTNSLDISKEFVNTQNSFTKADSVWDTPADPFILAPTVSPDTLFYPGQNPPFLYFYSNRKDANGDFYNPMMYNIMSSNLIKMSLRCIDLTHEQYNRIVVNERKCRKRFWGLE
jgi:hypothetical protein